jgi:hypothetical protein
MPPAFVQAKGGTSNTLNSLGMAFSSNNGAGDLLVCVGRTNLGNTTGLTVSDSQGNNWIIEFVDSWTLTNTFFMAYAANCKAGANTVTIAQTGANISGVVAEYSGIPGAAPLDKTGYADSGSGTWTAASSGNVIPVQNGELIIGGQGNATGPASVTAGSGFSNLNNDSGNFVSIESQVQTTAAAIAGTFTISASSGAAGILTFAPVSSTQFNVWSPQGNVVSNAGGVIYSNPNVIYDSNPAILTGEPMVFKMWCGTNSSGGEPTGTAYFESVDGIANWTPYSSNPVSAGVLPKVYKSGNTYYLYTGGSPINVQTSTDGVTFNTAVSTGLVGGGSTAWDKSTFQLQVLDIIAGTWYGYYNGENAATFPATPSQMGLATSTDGVHWTKYAGNPVISIVSSNYSFIKVGTTYYGYFDGLYNNTLSGQLGGLTSVFRVSSTSVFGPWTELTYNGVPVSTYYPTIASDFNDTALVFTIGDPTIVSAKGNMYLYYSVGSQGFPSGLNGAVALNTTPDTIVGTFEGVVGVPISGAPQINLNTLATDSGTGANQNPIAGNWTNITSALEIQRLSNQFVPKTMSTVGCAYWNAVTWQNDQWAQITVEASSSFSGVGPCVRVNESGTNTAYKFLWDGTALGTPGTWFIEKVVAGTTTTLIQSSGTSIAVSAGDTLLGVVNGTGLYLYYNGVLVGAWQGDASISSGAAGLIAFSNAVPVTDAAMTNFLAGDFTTSPPITFTLSGNAGVGAANVAYSGTGGSGSVIADGSGNYTISGLIPGTYVITPSLAGYTFSPGSATESSIGSNVTGVNFTATKNASPGSGDAGSFNFDYSFG